MNLFTLFYSMLMIIIIWVYFRYGIGAIYQKQERYELAEMHYKRALRINHSSALIMCHIAVVSITNAHNLN